jgi:hypothetical protein
MILLADGSNNSVQNAITIAKRSFCSLRFSLIRPTLVDKAESARSPLLHRVRRYADGMF